MEILPPEMFQIILNYFEKLYDILKLRQVSRRLKHLVDTYRLRRVAFKCGSTSTYKLKPVKNTIWIEISGAKRLNTGLSRSIFNGLHYLKLVHKMRRWDFHIDALGWLTNLRRLDVDWLDAHYGTKRLNLPNLVVLLVDRACEENYGEAFIEFDSPKLEVLRQPHLDNAVRVLHPQSVRSLWIDKLNEANPRLDLLAEFKNLQIFQANYLHFNSDIDVWPALNTNLKQLRFLGTFRYLNRWGDGNANYEGRVLDVLMAQKAKMDRSQTKVFFNAVQLIDGRPYNKYRMAEFRIQKSDPDSQLTLTLRDLLPSI